MRKQQFTIRIKLPSLNDYVNACRQSPYIGAALKKRTDAQIAGEIMAANIRRISDPCIVCMVFLETDKRRDVDNVESARKYILDALVGTGILLDDSPRYVVGAPSFTEYTTDQAGVVITLIEDADRGKLRERLRGGMDKIREG